MLLIGRISAASSRAAIHAGDGPTVTSATDAAYRGQSARASSAIVTGSASSPVEVVAAAGQVTFPP